MENVCNGGDITQALKDAQAAAEAIPIGQNRSQGKPDRHLARHFKKGENESVFQWKDAQAAAEAIPIN